MRTALLQPFTAAITLLVVAFAFAACLSSLPAVAQQATTFGSASGVTCPGGNVLWNGSINFLTTELFFELETPAFFLKKASTTWNEIEQLLDNPNFTLTWGATCNDAKGPVPGNEQGFPTYCTNAASTTNNPTGFIRRPTTVDGEKGRGSGEDWSFAFSG